MNSVRSNSLSLKYQGFPPLGWQDIRIRKFEFVAKTQFRYVYSDIHFFAVLKMGYVFLILQTFQSFSFFLLNLTMFVVVQV